MDKRRPSLVTPVHSRSKYRGHMERILSRIHPTLPRHSSPPESQNQITNPPHENARNRRLRRRIRKASQKSKLYARVSRNEPTLHSWTTAVYNRGCTQRPRTDHLSRNPTKNPSQHPCKTNHLGVVQKGRPKSKPTYQLSEPEQLAFPKLSPEAEPSPKQ